MEYIPFLLSSTIYLWNRELAINISINFLYKEENAPIHLPPTHTHTHTLTHNKTVTQTLGVIAATPAIPPCSFLVNMWYMRVCESLFLFLACDWLSKSKSHCDWQSVSQSVLVSCPIWGIWPEICLFILTLRKLQSCLCGRPFWREVEIRTEWLKTKNPSACATESV
jgi:hypothetical protein